ncbi:MAG: nucleotidyltransferase domain-containing protein [Deltaproteobacteria bacterium]|nr:nucleotidyltransferase domain-containing protein [Deltaproteobacteria bacterium]
MKLKNFFFDTSYQKILNFLSSNPNRTFFDREIAQKTKVSRGATNLALRKLAQAGLIILEKKGRMSFYSVDLNNPIIRQWKVLNNILELHQLKEKLKKISEKIILFGSAAEGRNIKESDIDIFVITGFPQKANEIISKSKRKIQLISKKSLEFVELKEKDPIFYDEVMKGIVLWEKSN